MSITIKQLKERIADMPDDIIIVLQCDDEGNRYRHVRGIECIVEGDGTNYFNDDEQMCYRESDLEDWGFEKIDPKLEKCVVVY